MFRKVLTNLQFYFNCEHDQKLSSTEALKCLNDFYLKDKPDFKQVNHIEKIKNLMIIVPVYNVEKFLEKNINSILNQKTDYSYDVVFVDDGSTDQSLNILNKYKDIENVSIITQKNNGVSSARNAALKNIDANYLLFVDSDDYISEDCVQKLLDCAYKKQCQIVQGNFAYVYKETIENNSLDEKSIPGYPWGKLISSELFENICFPKGFIFEDTIINTLIFPSANKITCIDDVVYYYRDNEAGISHSFIDDKKMLDTIYMTYFCYKESFDRELKIDYATFCQQVRINWFRIQKFPEKIIRASFFLMCDLYDSYYSKSKDTSIDFEGVKYYDYCFKNKKFKSFLILMNSWSLLLNK